MSRDRDREKAAIIRAARQQLGMTARAYRAAYGDDVKKAQKILVPFPALQRRCFCRFARHGRL